MATAKKTGIIEKMKDAVSGLFSSAEKRKSPARVEAGKKAATTAKVNKAVKTTEKAVKKVAAKVGGAARKASGKKQVAKKARR